MSEETPLQENHTNAENTEEGTGKKMYKLTALQLEESQTGPEGLTDDEVSKRLERDGPNTISEKKRNSIIQFLSYY